MSERLRESAPIFEPSVARQVDAVCDHFEDAWRRGERPGLREYLKGVGPDAHGLALRELLRIDVHYRRQAGDQPETEKYCQQFPEHAETIHQVCGLAETMTFGDRRPGAVSREQNLPSIPGYDILAELGHGGMGIVYKAKQLRLDRLEALKMIRTGQAAEPSELARFRTEAKALARLQHPNVVQVFDIDEHEGQVYCSLEYVEGGSLKDSLTAGPLSIDAAARLIEVLARAVHFAHERGVIHRDLKPGNVLLAVDGTPKIADFGLARLFDPASAGGEPADRITKAGTALGTPAYMAPEQADGQSGPAADVYALGVILYEVLTGRVPFGGEIYLQTILKARSEAVRPPRDLRPEIPERLQAICLKCLAKEPANRYPSAAALAGDLNAFLAAGETADFSPTNPVHERTVEIPRAAAAGLRRWWLWTAAALVSATIITGTWAWINRTKPAETEPLRGDLTVWVWSEDRGRQLQIGPNAELRALPVREDDRIQVEVELNQPAYVYLLWIDAAGSVTPLFPWNDPAQAGSLTVGTLVEPPSDVKPVESLRNPSQATWGYQADNTAGLDTVLLLGRRTPWPAERKLCELFGKLPEARKANPDEMAVRGWEDGQEVSRIRRDLHRGPTAASVDDQLLHVLERLKGDFELIRAVRFAHVGR